MKHKYVQFQLDACVKCSFQLDEILMQHDILGSVFLLSKLKWNINMFNSILMLLLNPVHFIWMLVEIFFKIQSCFSPIPVLVC
jgi:hypothetical protein